MTFSLDSLDLGSLTPPRKTFSSRNRPVCIDSTNWDWMMAEAEKSGRGSVQDRLDSWNEHRDFSLSKLDASLWPRIHKGMKKFVHRKLFSVTVAEIMETLSRSEAPFGGTRKLDREGGNLHNLTTPAPINLMLHSLVESTGRVPTWQDFETSLKERPETMLSWIAFQTEKSLDLFLGGWLTDPVTRALRYRLAAAYNSFIREIHFMAMMREMHDIHLAHHFLLDALWKIDFLYGGVAIELYVNNDDLKSETEGRKIRCHEANPGRDVLVLAFEVRQDGSTYNMPWLVTEDCARDTARRLRDRDFDHFGRREFFDK